MQDIQADKWWDTSYSSLSPKPVLTPSPLIETTVTPTLPPDDPAAIQRDICKLEISRAKGQALTCLNLGSSVTELTEHVLNNTPQDWLSDFCQELEAIPLAQLELEIKSAKMYLNNREHHPKDDHEALAIQLLKITLADVLRFKQRNQPMVGHSNVGMR